MRLSYEPKYGFRFSALDALAMVCGALVTGIGYAFVGELAFLVPYVLAHFFLFCNVFRIARNYELIWAGLFVANVCGCFAFDVGLLTVVAIQLPITVCVIGLMLRRSDYHGIFSKPRAERTWSTKV
jgi:hypothetical protein